MHAFWQGKQVLVTGGGGFIGACVVAALRQRGVADDCILPEPVAP
jgi:nucleoside-diphosphate-sugar epimerase